MILLHNLFEYFETRTKGGERSVEKRVNGSNNDDDEQRPKDKSCWEMKMEGMRVENVAEKAFIVVFSFVSRDYRVKSVLYCIHS